MATVRDIDTVEELTDILVSDTGGGGDVGAHLGDLLEIVAGEGNLVLGILRAVHGDTSGEYDAASVLLTDVVADLNDVVLKSNAARRE